MFSYLLRKVFGSANDRIIKSTNKIVKSINVLEETFTTISDSELKSYTNVLKQKLKEGCSLDSILPQAFAQIREASRRVLSMRHFDVQIIGGIVMHYGKIAEMRTGEGKTLVATLPAYLNALTGDGVHIVTVNDYLAKRDATLMGQLFSFLGITVGCLTNDMDEFEKKNAYKADITYGTNNEFGFDYLRDNLKHDLEQIVQRKFNYAIIDEVDSILIDEARTPLIISGPAENNASLYYKINDVVKLLPKECYEVDEKGKSVFLTDNGHEHIESILQQKGIIQSGSSLYDYDNMSVVHYINQALKAHHTFRKDVDYIVKEGKVMIIDEFVGRIMEGRRYSEGLHQAIEAKENVQIQNENQTLASITFQNYFRLYPKLAGMTGTAVTEANEFADIYKLDVVEIPTHMPIARKDEDDEIYQTAKMKYEAILKEIKSSYEIGQPVLVGTVSIEKSEYLSSMLKKAKIPHSVLNARYHQKEAEIIAQAGRFKSVTIATNMAGRGTDIMLGGNPSMLFSQEIESRKGELSQEESEALKQKIASEVSENREKVLSAGGLYVIGTERHESRRIDNQLRGRSGRQGDNGRTKFYLSLEDDLMRLFGSDKMGSMLTKLGLKEDEAIFHPWISKALQKAQQKVETRNYDIRKNLLKFDDVMNEQRKVIYGQRMHILTSTRLFDEIEVISSELNKHIFRKYITGKNIRDEWDINSLEMELTRIYDLHFQLSDMVAIENPSEAAILKAINLRALQHISEKLRIYGEDLIQEALKRIYLISLDHLWKEHLHTLDHMRAGTNLLAYANKDPLNEYKIEAFKLFKQMLHDLDELVTQRISRLVITHDLDSGQSEAHGTSGTITKRTDNLRYNRIDDIVIDGKIGRNEQCPCNSGKKFKHCHGSIQ